jgi:HK97 family phage prohead protease
METPTMFLPNKKDAKPGEIETKLINFSECKLAANENSADTMEFSGYGAAFGNIDSYGDIIQKGAFSGYLSDVASGKQEWPAMLTQHGGWAVSANDLTPVGVYTDLKEDDFGLKTAGNLAATPRGTEIHTLMKMQPRPAISGLSIGFFIREFEYGGKNDPYYRLLKRIDLVEISIVTFPANGKARISDVKTISDMKDHELERTLRDVLGLSQKEAKTVISRGFRALRTDADAGSEELKQIRAQLERNNSIFQ